MTQETKPNVDLQQLLAMLQNLPADVQQKIAATTKAAVDKADAQAKAQAKLNEYKGKVQEALATLVAEIKVNFDVSVRDGKVDVHLVGTRGGGGGGAGSGDTPSAGSGMSQKELVEKFTPDKLAEFLAADTTTGQGRGVRQKIAVEAYKIFKSQKTPTT